MKDFYEIGNVAFNSPETVEGLVSEVWPFERINEAIALVETGSVNRMVLRFNDKT